ncbi:hypothetical protein BABL1_gene_992 [Candidatus Babela massiliensis]|uniref:Uncharacterized protein n=1 Tax=Candidatus Babela massiliensis TaxID=673862 RepID=V6DH81_9BACT|nr:hypothetical protein BABL1_gene_992 [Candidatus Babela massiliensis]
MTIIRYLKQAIFKLFLILLAGLIAILLRTYLMGPYDYPTFYFTWQFIITFIIFNMLFQYLRDLGFFGDIII